MITDNLAPLSILLYVLCYSPLILFSFIMVLGTFSCFSNNSENLHIEKQEIPSDDDGYDSFMWHGEIS